MKQLLVKICEYYKNGSTDQKRMASELLDILLYEENVTGSCSKDLPLPQHRRGELDPSF